MSDIWHIVDYMSCIQHNVQIFLRDIFAFGHMIQIINNSLSQSYFVSHTWVNIWRKDMLCQGMGYTYWFVLVLSYRTVIELILLPPV